MYHKWWFIRVHVCLLLYLVAWMWAAANQPTDRTIYTKNVCVMRKLAENKENTTNYRRFNVTSRTETTMNATRGSQMVAS